MAPNTKELEVLYENESMSSMEVDEEQQEKHMQVLPWKPRGFSRFNLFSNMLRNPIVFQSDFNFSHLNGIQVTPPKHRVASGSSSRRHDQHRSKHSRRDSSAHSCSECHSAPVHSSACPGRNSRQEAFYEDDRRHNDHECDKNCALYFKENKQKKKKPCNEVHETACCQTRYSRHPQTAISDNSMPTECYDIVRSASNYACKGRGSSAERGRQHSNHPKRHSIAHSVTHGGSCRDCRPSDYSEFKEARAHALRNPLVVPSCTKLSKKPPVCDTSCKKDCPGPAPSSGPSRGYGHAPAPPPVHTRTICGCKGAAPSAPPKVRHRVDQDDDMCQQQRHQQGARYAPSYDYAPTCSRNTFERCRSGDTLDQRSVESYPYSANENRAMSPAPRASYRGSSAPDAMDYNAMAMHCGNHGCYVPASYFRSTPAGAKRKPRNTGAKRKNTSAHLSARRTKSGYSASNMFIPAGFYMMPSTALMSYHMQPQVAPLKKRRNRNRLGGSGVSGHLKRIPRRTPSGRVLLNSYLYKIPSNRPTKLYKTRHMPKVNPRPTRPLHSIKKLEGIRIKQREDRCLGGQPPSSQQARNVVRTRPRESSRASPSSSRVPTSTRSERIPIRSPITSQGQLATTKSRRSERTAALSSSPSRREQPHRYRMPPQEMSRRPIIVQDSQPQLGAPPTRRRSGNPIESSRRERERSRNLLESSRRERERSNNYLESSRRERERSSNPLESSRRERERSSNALESSRRERERSRNPLESSRREREPSEFKREQEPSESKREQEPSESKRERERSVAPSESKRERESAEERRERKSQARDNERLSQVNSEQSTQRRKEAKPRRSTRSMPAAVESEEPITSTEAAAQPAAMAEPTAAQMDTYLDNNVLPFYRGSFLAVRGASSRAPGVHASRIMQHTTRGSLIHVAQQMRNKPPTGLMRQMLPKWHLHGFMANSPIMEMRSRRAMRRYEKRMAQYQQQQQQQELQGPSGFNWRKYCPNWLLKGKATSTV